ncbi:periplasmic heavy metal sensor [Brachyspira pilosicoli]|uniref:Periplasmic heavy metal sensor n=1 Tax=Brachyspira pilosicoli TaxID=52584 RepID=A0A5C8EMA3_BRAPL|nr:periplasmic heavy metal sensor [Brachyspira pilosicoli]TXJ37260.1 periplasmic heavy metal sensor [Brachyspira pilosicoli]
MKKGFIILVSIAIMVFGSVSLFGQYARGYGMGYGRGYGRGYGMGCGYGRGYDRGYGRGMGCNYGYGRGYGYYNLTQEQINQIQSIESKYFPQIDDLRREVYNKTQTINLEMSKQNPDQNAINKAIDERTKTLSDLDKLRSEFFLEIDKVFQVK